MDKQECKQIVELLSVTWDMALDNATLTLRVKGYWEYIQDLPYEATKQTIKRLGMASQRWAPKPGMLRIQTLSDMSGEALPPEPEEAWTILQAIGQKIYSGVYNWQKPHPVVSDTIKRLGNNAVGLVTNSDRAMFMELYSKTREAYILEKYGTAR